MKRLIILLVVLTCSIHSHAQDWVVLAEAGLNVGGIPTVSKGAEGDKITHVPRIGPAAGVRIQRVAKSGFYGELSVRYLSTGSRSIYFNDERNRPAGDRFTAEETDKFAFNKIATGAGIGYRFTLLKKSFNFEAGYRKGFMLSGKYQYKLDLKGDDGNHVVERGYNPFTHAALDKKAERTTNEVFAGLGMSIGERWNANVQFAVVSDLSFIENASGQFPWDFHTYTTDDLTVTVSYRVNK